MKASVIGNLETVDLLLSKGANIEATDMVIMLSFYSTATIVFNIWFYT
jgi:hypothetical protein